MSDAQQIVNAIGRLVFLTVIVTMQLTITNLLRMWRSRIDMPASV